MSAGRCQAACKQLLSSCTTIQPQICSHLLQICMQWPYNEQRAEPVVLMCRFRAHNIRAASEYQRTSSLSPLHSGVPSRGSSRSPPLPGHHPAQCNQGGAHCRGQVPAHRGQGFRQQGADRGQHASHRRQQGLGRGQEGCQYCHTPGGNWGHLSYREACCRCYTAK